MDRRHFLKSGLGAAGLGVAATSIVPAATAAAAGPLERTFADAKPLNLKITDLRTFLVDAGNDENYVFVKLYTNQGITGLGEGTLSNKGEVIAAAIEAHKRYLVGKDPTEIERHWRGMFIGPRYRGGPVLMSALSAVEIALWDILGKALGRPIWQLLGGKARDRVRLYCHEGYLDRISHTKKRKAKSYEEELDLWRQKKEDGWTCVKGGFYSGGKPIDHRVAIRTGVEHLARVRDIVGPDFDIIVEAHGKTTPLSAVEFCNRVEEFRPFWVEEVTQLENEVIEEVRQIRAQTRVPLATGERLTSRYYFAPLCSERLVDVIMPDVVHVGGISELRKIAILAEAFRVDVSPHNPQSEVSTLASMHVCMSTPNCTILEIGSGQHPFWQDLFYGGHFSYERGFANPPSRPGLGIDLDEKVAAKYPFKEKNWNTLQTPDGAYVDR
jgi:galactonate dehydratase